LKLIPKILPQAWSKIYMDVADVIRHEIEHLTQAGPNLRSDKYMEDDIDLRDMINKLKILPKKNYYLLRERSRCYAARFIF
jgi:methionine synthase II (cobalamin-independent)